jgi:uncharacterized protein YndB with AHSA1/START domain
MPKQKDLKRIVRSRMQKTGESYTAARLQVLTKSAPDYANIAGMSDAAVKKQTGRNWMEWVAALDVARSSEKPHREIARSQMVTVGYERIRGLRERGQRRDGGYEAGKSRTYAVSVERLYSAFSNARTRRRWLADKIGVRSASPNKRMRVAWNDDTVVEILFTKKASRKSSVAVTHQKLPDKASAERMKAWWNERLDVLGDMFS